MEYSNLLRISYYKIIAPIHEEHKVYLVQHIDSKKIFIEKILDVFNPQVYEYLYEHPIKGTPKIVDYCQINNQLILIEEYISGVTLEECIEAHTLDDQKIASYMYNLCQIVQQFHSCTPAIIHRDIKPSNCIINYSDELILLDFNAAKQESNKDSDTVLLGTQGYASPEQYGFGSSTCQSDIYSMGITCKEMVNSLSTPCQDFDFIILKCTQLDPAKRYNSVVDLEDAILSLQKIEDKKPDYFKKYCLPGYRTHTPWKMAIATAIYIFTILLSISLESKESSSLKEIISTRVFFFFSISSCILISFNYLDIQKSFPLCTSKNKLLHYIGILIFDAITILFYLLIYIIITS